MFSHYSLELLWLLPVAAASGWLVASWNRARDRESRSNFCSNYFKGLNYVLNEQPDKAIEVFCKMLESDSETVEVQMAVGNLFRRRGEVDRAIHIHQNLVDRPKLSATQHDQALLELGQDFMRAGLLDRAEALFTELASTEKYNTLALYQLLDIFEQEKDWHKAIVVAKRLDALGEPNILVVIAQYYCELAEESLNKRDDLQAQEDMQNALAIDAHCARANFLLGDLHRLHQRYEEAIVAYKAVEKQNIDYFSEVIAPLQVCYEQLNQQAQLIVYLKAALEKHPLASIVLVLANLIGQQQGNEAAIDFLLTKLNQFVFVRGLEELVTLYIQRTEGSARQDLQMIKDLVVQLIEKKPMYQCKQCGFSSRLLYWQCPSCKTWESLKPLQRFEGSTKN